MGVLESIKKSEDEDLLTYAGTVYGMCERFKLKKLNPDMLNASFLNKG